MGPNPGRKEHFEVVVSETLETLGQSLGAGWSNGFDFSSYRTYDSSCVEKSSIQQ